MQFITKVSNLSKRMSPYCVFAKIQINNKKNKQNNKKNHIISKKLI